MWGPRIWLDLSACICADFSFCVFVFVSLLPVLPKPLRERLANELNRRLDLDIDEMLESPKLRLQLAPAELDKSLLELYNKVVEGPSGDVFRVILGGGGSSIALQNMYMKRQAARQSRKKLANGGYSLDLLPSFVWEAEEERTAEQSIRRALSRNLAVQTITEPSSSTQQTETDSTTKQTPSMSCFGISRRIPSLVPQSWSGLRAPRSFPKSSSSSRLSLLI